MDKDEITSRIVRGLARGDSHSDIVMAVCRKTGSDWPTAEALVNEVAADRSQQIARRMLPLGLSISLLVLAAGLGLLGLTAVQAGDLYGEFHVRHSTTSAITALGRVLFATPLLWEQGVLGVILIVGSGLGLRRTLSDL